MRIAHVSYNESAGGAAVAAWRLHKGLLSIGQASSMKVRERQTDDPTVEVIAASTPEDAAHADLVRQIFLREAAGQPVFSRGGFLPFHTERSPVGRALVRALADQDVVNLHWTRALLDWQAFFPSRPSSQVVVWTLHDMHPFTGGCHYGTSCGRYSAICGACPALESQADPDLSTEVQRRKREAVENFSGRALHIVSPSRWLADQARASTVFQGLPVDVIPYSFDTALFRPRNRVAVRQSLGIDERTRVLFFVSHSVTDPRKGLDVVDAALERLGPHPDTLVLLVGNDRFEPRSVWPFRHLGPVSSADRLAELYSAADLTLVPSREDNLPNTVLESVGCGTPVIGSAIGGIPDMITHGENGFLAECGDAGSWAAAIAEALALGNGLAMLGRRARSRAEREHSLDIQAERYLALYERLGARVTARATMEE